MKLPNKGDYFTDLIGNIIPYDKAYRSMKEYAYALEDYITHLTKVKNNGVVDTVVQCDKFRNILTSSSATKCVCGKEKHEHEHYS